MATFIVNTDGGSRGNPGPAGVGVVITRDGQPVGEWGKTIGATTNNQAEYQALAWAVELLDDQAKAGDQVEFQLDSELVTRQMQGVYKVKDAGLFEWRQKIIAALGAAPWRYSFKSIRRELNKEADRLVNAALDGLI